MTKRTGQPRGRPPKFKKKKEPKARKPPGRPPKPPKMFNDDGTPITARKAVAAKAATIVMQAFAVRRHKAELPLDIILEVAKGATEDEVTNRQLQAAIAAAPYCHARLTAVAVKDVTPPSHEQAKRQHLRNQMLNALLQLARPEPMTALEIAQHRDVIDATAPVRPKGDAS